MARVVTIGFETGVEGYSHTLDATTPRQTVSLNGGSKCITHAGDVSESNGTAFSALSELYVRVCFRMDTLPSRTTQIFGMLSTTGPAPEVYIAYTTSGQLLLGYSNYYSGVTGWFGDLFGNSGANVMAAGQYYRIEVYYLGHASGQVIVKVNGDIWITYSGGTIQWTGTVAYVSLGAFRGIGTGNNHFIDDIAVNSTAGTVNNSWCGDGYIQIFSPNAAGATTQWVPSTGDNYNTVNEFPTADDADYVLSTAADELDLYGMPDLPSEAGVVKTLTVSTRGNKIGTTNPNIRLVVRTNSINYESNNIALPNDPTFSLVSNTWETSPDTSALWTVANANALQIGIKSKA